MLNIVFKKSASMAQLIVNGTESNWACWRCSQPRYSFDWRALHRMPNKNEDSPDFVLRSVGGQLKKKTSQRTVDSFLTRQSSWYLETAFKFKYLTTFFGNVSKLDLDVDEKSKSHQVSGCPSSTTCGLLILHVGVSKNRGGKPPKMDGENNGNPY